MRQTELYFDTVPEIPYKIVEQARKNKTQNDEILTQFYANWKRDFTPFEMQQQMRYCGHEWPITSVRRAINNLERLGYIERVGKRRGDYGATNNTWKYKQQ